MIAGMDDHARPERMLLPSTTRELGAPAAAHNFAGHPSPEHRLSLGCILCGQHPRPPILAPDSDDPCRG